MDPEALFALMYQELRASTHDLLETVRHLHCEEDRALMWRTWLAWNEFLKEYFPNMLVREQERISGSHLTLLKWSWWRWSVFWLLPLCIRIAVWWCGLRYVVRKWTTLSRWRHLRTAVRHYTVKERYKSARAFRHSFCSLPPPHTKEWLKLPYSSEKRADRSASSEGADVSRHTRGVHSPFPIRNWKKVDQRAGVPLLVSVHRRTVTLRPSRCSEASRRRKSIRHSSSYFQCRLWIGWILFLLSFLCFISILFLYPLLGQLLHSLIGSLPIPPSWVIVLESVFFYPAAYQDVLAAGVPVEGGVEGGNVNSRIRLPFASFPSLWGQYKHGYYRSIRGVHQWLSFVLTEKYLYYIIPVFIALVHQSIVQVSALVDAITLYGYSHTASMAERALEMEEKVVAVREEYENRKNRKRKSRI